MDGQDDTPEVLVRPQTRSRIPLVPRRSPPTPPKQVRRKESFIRRLDSSEESPSPHGSIFEALYQSATNSDDAGSIVEPAIPLPSSGHSTTENDENVRQPSTSRPAGSEGPFLYGHGTILETIKERASHGSMRILARRKSVDDLKRPFVQTSELSTRKSPLRQKSHSLDDLEAAKEAYHVGSIAKEPEIHEVYAEPRAPIQEPPQRPATPPGMPSWTEHQLRSGTRPKLRASTSLRQFFGLGTGLQSGEGRQSGERPAQRPARARVPRIARFRPPKSAYGRIDQHPFNDAPTAVVDPFVRTPAGSSRKRKSVRFTPSTAAQGSDAAPDGDAGQCAATDSRGVTQADTISISSVPSTSTQASPRRPCPHRKGRLALAHANSTLPGVDYRDILVHPLTRDISHASLPRLAPPSPTHASAGRSARGEPWDLGIVEGVLGGSGSGAASNSSTTHLMSGALLAPSPSPTPRSRPEDGDSRPETCWRCRLDVLRERLSGRWGDLRRRGSRWLWFVCCGFDPEDEASELAPRNVRVEVDARGYGDGDGARDRWYGATAADASPRAAIVYTPAWIL